MFIDQTCRDHPARLSARRRCCYLRIGVLRGGQVLRGHVPAPVRQERAAGADRNLSAHDQLHDRPAAEMVKISPTWKPQTLNAMRRLERVLIDQPDRKTPLAQGIRLHLPHRLSQDLFFQRPAPLKHRRRDRFGPARGGRGTGCHDRQVRQGHRPHGRQHQRHPRFLGDRLDFAAPCLPANCARPRKRRKKTECKECLFLLLMMSQRKSRPMVILSPPRSPALAAITP